MTTRITKTARNKLRVERSNLVGDYSEALNSVASDNKDVTAGRPVSIWAANRMGYLALCERALARHYHATRHIAL